MKNRSEIIRAITFNNKARVAAIDTTDIVNELITIHDLSPLATAVLGRAITIGAYLSSNLKHFNNKFNLIIDGGGPIGQIFVAGNGKFEIKGFVQNPQVSLPFKNAKFDVGGAVGKNGYFNVIQDLGLKELYKGSSELVSGELGIDYATYILKSHGVKNAVVLGVLVDKNGCKASGGIFIELLPGADENHIFVLEDIISLMGNFSTLLNEKSVEEIMDFYFGHFETQILSKDEIKLRCDCDIKVPNVVKGLGKKQVEDIIAEDGKINIKCDYCSQDYNFYKNDIEKLFNVNN